MRFCAIDWGTSRFRAFLVDDSRPDGDRVVARAESQDGISRLRAGEHRGVFERHCGAWLAAEPDLPVVMAGMVGSREGWVQAPYAACPAGADEIAARLTEADLGEGRRALVVPGAISEEDGAIDVMRGEETHLLGAGVQDGLVCLPGTHCKWAEMRDGRLVRFATFMTGEMHALLREHSMIGRPATEPADESGFALGPAAAEREGGLLNLLFGARAATVAGRLPSAQLAPYLSGLMTGQEIAGAFARFGTPRRVTIVADRPRADLYVEALGARGIATRVVGQDETLLAGLARILAAAGRG